MRIMSKTQFSYCTCNCRELLPRSSNTTKIETHTKQGLKFESLHSKHCKHFMILLEHFLSAAPKSQLVTNIDINQTL